MRRVFLALALLSCSSLADEWTTGRQGRLTFHLAWHQDPNTEIVECHYFKSTNDTPVEVDHLRLAFPTGSHHVHIYRADSPEPDGVRDCSSGIDWTRWSLVVGAQTEPIDWVLPDGVTIPIAPHQQFLVQVHWLNTTTAPIDRAVDIELHLTQTSTAHLGVAFGVAKDVRMQPGDAKTVAGFAPVPEGAHLVAVMGHFHGRGRRYDADLRSAGADAPRLPIYAAQDEQTFEFKRYSPEPLVQTNEGIAFHCHYFNDADVTLTWGPDTRTQEHCNLAAYYWPADPQHLSHLFLSGEIAGISGDVVAGEPSQLSVELIETAADAGVDVTITSDDLSGMPAVVHVPAWQRRASFVATGTRPTRGAHLSATTGAGWQDAEVAVWGLALSEVFYNPDLAGSGQQWVEIANVSRQPVDLSGYSLGIGGPNWAQSRVPIGQRTLPPGGCLVVGGASNPKLPPENLAAGLLIEREPLTLGFGLDGADGVALFDVTADASLPDAPLDAVVWGGPNAHSLVGADGLPLLPEPGVAPGSSLERNAAAEWTAQLAPSPGICRATHAP